MKELLQNLVKLQELEFSEMVSDSTEAAVAELRGKIPLPILEHYDRLADRGKTGIAAVRHQVCMGCHIRVPFAAIITLMRAEDIQMCGNCGRYLYLPADEKNELPEPVTTARPAAAKHPRKPKSLVATV